MRFGRQDDGSRRRPAAPSPGTTESPEPSPSESPTASASATPSQRATAKSTPVGPADPGAKCPARARLGAPAPGRTSLVAAGAFAGSVDVSGDGRYVAFRSDSPTILPSGEDSNGFQDIFVHDRNTGSTKRVNLAPDGSQANGHSSGVDISADGNWVLFVSKAPNLAGGKSVGRVYLRDLRNGTTTQLPAVDPDEDNPEIVGRSLSADGRWATFQWQEKSYLYDRTTKKVAPIPGYENAKISADGSTIVQPVEKDAKRLFLAVRDRAGSKVETFGAFGDTSATGRIVDFSISADGNRVAFVFEGTDLSGADCKDPMGLYVYDRAKGTTTRLAVAPAYPRSALISDDGRWVVTSGEVTYGGGVRFEVMRHDLRTGDVTVVSVADDESPASGEELGSTPGAVSKDGRVVAFTSNATNLTPGTAGQENVFVR